LLLLAPLGDGGGGGSDCRVRREGLETSVDVDLVEPDAAGGEKGVGEGGEGGGGRHRGGEAAAAVDAQHVLHGEWRRRRHLAGGQLDSARGCGCGDAVAGGGSGRASSQIPRGGFALPCSPFRLVFL